MDSGSTAQVASAMHGHELVLTTCTNGRDTTWDIALARGYTFMPKPYATPNARAAAATIMGHDHTLGLASTPAARWVDRHVPWPSAQKPSSRRDSRPNAAKPIPTAHSGNGRSNATGRARRSANGTDSSRRSLRLVADSISAPLVRAVVLPR